MSLTTKQEMDAEKRKRCLAAAQRRANAECQTKDAVDQNETQQPQEKHVEIVDLSEETEVVDLLEEPAFKKTRLEASETVHNDAKLQQQWTCSHCTLLNTVSDTKCAACGMKKDSSVPPVLDRIKLATLNVSCFETSHVAPDGFNPMETFSQALLDHDPDIICLQEATNDGESFYDTLLPGYVCLGKASAHVEYAMLFVKESLAAHASRIKLADSWDPYEYKRAVLARLQFAGNESVVVGSCHFAPFNSGSSERLEKMKEMLSHCHPGDKVLIAGDYNMRQAEDADFESLGLSEAWKEAGSDKAKKFTFDSDRNPFNRPSSFRKSHGRYDRVYLRGFAVDDFDLFANEPLGENARSHFLSDHYGVRVSLQNADSKGGDDE